jgi:hypothetical protein
MEGLAVLAIMGGTRMAQGVSARNCFRLSIWSTKQEIKKYTI